MLLVELRAAVILILLSLIRSVMVSLMMTVLMLRRPVFALPFLVTTLAVVPMMMVGMTPLVVVMVWLMLMLRGESQESPFAAASLRQSG